MKSASTAAGAASGCVVWLVLVMVFGLCLLPVAFVAALFTATTDLAAGVVGPLVCPAESAATIETAPTTFYEEGGITREGIGREMVCVDAAGTVVARPAPLPNWIWSGLLFGGALLLSIILALVFAAPAGVLVGGVINRFTKK